MKEKKEGRNIYKKKGIKKERRSVKKIKEEKE